MTKKSLLWGEPCSLLMEFSALTASTFLLGFRSLTNSSQAFVSTTCWLKLLFSRSPGTSILLYKIASSQSSSDSTSEQHLAQLVTPTFLKCFSHLASRTQQSRSFPPTSLAVLSQFPLLDSSLLPRPLNVRPAQGSVFVLFDLYSHPTWAPHVASNTIFYKLESQLCAPHSNLPQLQPAMVVTHLKIPRISHKHLKLIKAKYNSWVFLSSNLVLPQFSSVSWPQSLGIVLEFPNSFTVHNYSISKFASKINSQCDHVVLYHYDWLAWDPIISPLACYCILPAGLSVSTLSVSCYSLCRSQTNYLKYKAKTFSVTS